MADFGAGRNFGKTKVVGGWGRGELESVTSMGKVKAARKGWRVDSNAIQTTKRESGVKKLD